MYAIYALTLDLIYLYYVICMYLYLYFVYFQIALINNDVWIIIDIILILSKECNIIDTDCIRLYIDWNNNTRWIINNNNNFYNVIIVCIIVCQSDNNILRKKRTIVYIYRIVSITLWNKLLHLLSGFSTVFC